MPLQPGTRLGPYEIVAPLGAGGMGEVYRAHDARLGRDVAVKVLPDELASRDRMARLEREARAVASLNHPNIVTLHSIEDADGTRFLTMELVDGQTLADLVTPGGLPAARVLNLLIPLADALAAAHAKGVVHRDLKPANVMVTADDRVKVLDFGLAKRAPGSDPRHTDASAPLSMAGELFGTVPYMAPEQLFGEHVDARTDLYALGLVAFELLAGRRPFPGRTFFEVTAAIVRGGAPSIASMRADVPPEFARIVDRCLAVQPRDRYETAADVADALRAIARGGAERTVPAPREPERLPSIAVLPFANRSADVDDAYFSDGLADELLGMLSKIKGLRVSARASSFHFHGKGVALADIGRALNVVTLLDGSVRRAGNRVRISVQLVNVDTGFHLWSETYDRTLDDIFAVQDDIARSVVRELRTTLLGEDADSDASDRARAEVRHAGKGRSTDAEALRLYLLARHFMDQFNRDATVKAVAHLMQAVERDPAFALAWTELSVAHMREVGWMLVNVEEGLKRARAAVRQALALEPTLAEAHAQDAWIRIFHDWDWRGAEDALVRARRYAPGSAAIQRLSGVLESVLGRLDAAIGIYRRSLENDPLSAAAYHSLGLALQAVDDVGAAEDAFRRALELAPQRIATHAYLAMNALAQGRLDAAVAQAECEPETGYRLWALAIAHGARGDAAASAAALLRLIGELAEGWSLQIAEVYAASGDADAAFEWLEHAYAKRDVGLAQLQTSPRLRGLHVDARWREVLSRMGLRTS